MPNHLPSRPGPTRAEANAKRPVRWMSMFLVALAVAGIALALLWANQADAQSFGTLIPDAAGVLVAGASAEPLRCEMVRIWPLPADCQFVFGAPAR